MEMTFHPYYKNSWALIIGINAYQYAPPLSYAFNDVDVIASVLTSEFNFPSDNLTILKDQAALKQAIMENFLGD